MTGHDKTSRFTSVVTYKYASSSASNILLFSKRIFNIMEGEGQEIEEKVPVKLNAEVKNSIRHTFEALQLSNGRNSTSGEVPKSKLQVLCATISRDFAIPYSSDDLDNYKADKKSLSCGEFVDYLEDELLPKGKGKLIKLSKVVCAC